LSEDEEIGSLGEELTLTETGEIWIFEHNFQLYLKFQPALLQFFINSESVIWEWQVRDWKVKPLDRIRIT